MKKILITALLALTLCLSVFVTASAESLPAFTEDFESYSVDGNYIENDKSLTSKWDNNIFRGGEPLGMDSHLRNIGKIEYENGVDGNKVLHLKNTEGANTFFYMGPGNDYRVRNFTAQFRVKFLVDGVPERSWVGISFRKRVNSHYTGTNNLMFVIQRYVTADEITAHPYAVFDGGSTTDLVENQELYGESLKLELKKLKIDGCTPNEDTNWIDYKLEVKDNNYKIYVNGIVLTDCTFDVNNFDYYGYLSLNCCTSNILIDDFSVTVQDTELPPEILPLEAPVITLDKATRTVNWEYVDGASGYLVNYGKSEKVVYTNSYTLPANLRSGTYEITVTSLSDDTFIALNSAPSNKVTLTVEGEKDSEKTGGCKSFAGAELPVIGLLFVGAAVIGARRRKYE